MLFRTDSPELPPGTGASFIRLFAYDRLAGDVSPLAVNELGESANGLPSSFNIPGQGVLDASISGDGGFVALSTSAWNLGPGDGNASPDVYVLDRTAAALDLVASDPATETEAGRGFAGTRQGQSLTVTPAEDGSWNVNFLVINRGPIALRPVLHPAHSPVSASWEWPEGTAFEDGRYSLPPLEPGNSFQVAVQVQSQPGLAEFIELHAATAESDGPLESIRAVPRHPLAAPGSVMSSWTFAGQPQRRHTEHPSLSADGTRLVFSSIAEDAAEVDSNSGMDAFLIDTKSGAVSILSRAGRGGTQGNDWSFGGKISADGQFAVFTSFANNLGPDRNFNGDVFVKNLQTGAIELISRNLHSGSAGNLASGYGGDSEISAGGEFVLFQSNASNFIVGDTNQFPDIFLADRAAQKLELISRTPSGSVPNHRSMLPRLASESRFAAFTSLASDLVAGDENQLCDAFFLDRERGTLELLSASTAGVPAAGSSFVESMSDDARFFIILSDAPDLPGAIPDSLPHFYLLDRESGWFTPVETWQPEDSAGWRLETAFLDRTGRWITTRWGRSAGSERLNYETRIMLIDRSSGRRIQIASASRGAGTPSGGFSEVTVAGPVTGDRYQAFLAEGRENAPFTPQAYIFDRAVPSLGLLAGRETPREMDPGVSARNEIILLAQPGGSHPFQLTFRNTGEFEDTFELTAEAPSPDQLPSLFPTGAAAGDPPLALPALFENIPPGGEITLRGFLSFPEENQEPGPVHVTIRSRNNLSVSKRFTLVPWMDTDSDGLADAWETRYFGAIAASNGESDADSDAAADRIEFIAGTDPLMAASFPSPVSLERMADGRLRLSWTGRGRRGFTVERAASIEGPFSAVASLLPEGSSEEAFEIEFLDASPSGQPAAFYRVATELP